jgi:glycosyltransferase involved in cell wall biosynthesis
MSSVIISIVVPVYNSQDCVPALHSAVKKALEQFGAYELILVNDKSHDRSWQEIERVCALDNKVIGISFRKNFGQDNALIAGLSFAKGEYVVIMDDDLQHSPDDILKLYEECKKGYDVCFALFEEKKQKGWKNMGSWLNGKLAEKLLQKPNAIYLSPFKIIKREVVNEILKYPGAYPYIDATILTITSNLTQIPIEHHDRYKGKSNFSFIRSLSVFLNNMTNYSAYPLRLITKVGFTVSIFSILAGIAYLVDYMVSSHKVEGWITVVILIIFFGGLTVMCLGLIGEYIARIFMSVNKKPQYTLDKVVNYRKE